MLTRAPAGGRRTPRGRAPRRARPGAARSPRAPPPQPLASRPGRRATTAFASVFRRWENAASTTRRNSPGRQAPRPPSKARRAPSRRSAAAGSTVRDTGCEPRPLRRQLHEHRHRPVGLASTGSAKNRSATSRCTITHHRSSGRQPVEALDHERRGDVVGQVRDQLRRRRIERAERSPEGVSPEQVDVVAAMPRRRSGRLEAAVELDRVHEPHPGGEEAGQHARARPRPRGRRRPLRARPAGRSRRGCSRRRGSAGRADFLGTTPLMRRARTRRRRLRRSAPRAPRGRRRAPRRGRRGCATTYAGSLGVPRTGCGARYGLSVSARMRSAGTSRSGSSELGGLRVGDVPGEGDVVAAARARPRADRARRSSGARPRRRNGSRAAAVSSAASRLWMTTGRPRSSASSSCSSRRRRCSTSVAKRW